MKKGNLFRELRKSASIQLFLIFCTLGCNCLIAMRLCPRDHLSRMQRDPVASEALIRVIESCAADLILISVFLLHLELALEF